MQNSIWVLLILLLFILTTKLSLECQEKEQEALLSFKQNLTNESSMLSSWVGNDCCRWWGVGCNNRTGHVIKLELGNNSFVGSWPLSLHLLQNLEILNLSKNFFQGSIPTSLAAAFPNLKVLDLSSNRFHGSIPTALGNVTTLEVLILYHNELEGTLPASLGELSNLRELDLGSNQLSGEIPSSMGKLSNLKGLFLEGNQLSCRIPISLGRLSNLVELDLRDNKLNGVVPESLGLLSELMFLSLGDNSFDGIVSEVHFTKLHKLQFLSLDGGPLCSFKMRDGWLPPFQLKYLYMRSCKVGPQFPEWLQMQTGLEDLVMADAGILGSIPNWFQNISSQLRGIDLSYNNIYGEVAGLGACPHLTSLDLSNNHINQSIPHSICEMRNLSVINLSKNNLSGAIPSCLGTLQSLQMIDLAHNNLSGRIPSSIGQLTSLVFLFLSNNKFQGELPSTLRYCVNLKILNLGNNILSGSIPTWIGESLPSLRVLKFSSNNYTGLIPRELCYLNKLHVLDVARNNLFGTLPLCFGNLSGMLFNKTNGSDPFLLGNTYFVTQVIKGRDQEYFYNLEFVVNLDLSDNNLVGHIPHDLTTLSGLISLNLSGNHLSGDIPKNIGQMRSLESLDLSRNNLSGPIPQSLSLLSFLAKLNLSYNNLSGPIPTGNQLRTLEDPSIYQGINNLCGPPVRRNCWQEPQADIEEKGKGEIDGLINKWFYIGLTSGFAVGFCGVCGFFILNQDLLRGCCQFVEDIKNKLVMAMARIVRLKDRLKVST